MSYFVGARENTAIVQGSPEGTVRYRGMPTFTPEDARLFAAAPEMLAALHSAVDVLPDCDNPSADDVLAQCRAAIAKAEGR